MAEVPYSRIGELLRGLFEVLMEHPDGLPARQAIAATEQRVPATPYEQTTLPTNGERRYENILRWMTVDCVKAGWIIKAHGRWSITDDGRAAYDSIPDPEAFYRKANQLYHEWRKNTPKSPTSSTTPEAVAADAPDEKSAGITFEQAEEQAWTEIERHVTTMPPYEFQELVASLLRAMSYHVGWVAPPGKDGGVDIVAYNDPLGTRPPRIKVQVKRQQARVDVNGLRSFMALLGADDVGLFVNTGGFTKDAQDEARTQHTRRITLLDLERLLDLWTEHYGRLDEAARRRLPLQPIYFLAPEG
ncbi:MAG TPA: restriction endonuclease [Gemmatimonadales bacterium]